MATKNNIGDEDFTNIVSTCKALVEKHAQRNDLFDDVEAAYFMQDSDLPTGSHIKETISPDGRNAVQSAVRLISAADPVWDVPDEYNTKDIKGVSSEIERLANSIWYAAGMVRKKPVHYDVVLSAILYGEVHMLVSLVKDMAELATNPGTKKRYQRLETISPVIFTVSNPKTGFPEFDDTGLIAFHSKNMRTVAQLRQEFGEDVETLLEGRKFTDKLEFNTYWDDTYKALWLTEFAEEPLVAIEHGLDYMPISATIVEGGEIFVEDDQDTRQPFLYTLLKSGFLKRLSLAYTSMYTSMFSVASNPTLVYRRNNPEKDLFIDYSTPGGIAYIDINESIDPMVKNAVDESILKGLEIAETKLTESTLYKQVVGEPMGANAPFSMVALLHQAGRLPLIPYQRMANVAISEAMSIGLNLLRGAKGVKKVSAMGKEGQTEFDIKKLPQVYQLLGFLDINLPQDERQNVVMATQATFGETPLVSREYARKNWLKIKQPDMEQEIVWAEKMADAKVNNKVQEILMQAQLAMQQQMQAGAGTAQGEQGMFPQGPQTGNPMEGLGAEGLAGLEDMANPSARPGVPGQPALFTGNPNEANPIAPNIAGEEPGDLNMRGMA